MSIPPVTPLAYEGAQQPVPYRIQKDFAPGTTNYQFDVPTIMVDPTNSLAYILLSKPGNVADWVLFAGGSGDIIEFTVPSGTSPVVPDDGSIALLAGTGMTITGGTNSITFASSSGGYTWNTVTSSTQTVVAQNVYVVNRSGGVTFSLPTTATLGQTFGIVGYVGAWSISLTTGQTIVFGANTASTSLSSTIVSNTVFISCIVATASSVTVWKVTQVLGNLTIV